MTICTIVGARPQFVKAAVVSSTLRDAGVTEILVHTGQHYDEQMSRIFFEDLGIPQPEVNLGVGSGSHAYQTAEMMVGLERFLACSNPPDWLLVYGDTNTTLAAALTASKLHIPIAHVEAGLRSFNPTMPEEINRLVVDRLSRLLLCPTPTAVANLAAEGITDGVVMTGDVMLEATHSFAEIAATLAPLSSLISHPAQGYYLATIHRPENTDEPTRLQRIFDGLGRLDRSVILPMHPRTRAKIGPVQLPPNVEVIQPVGYLQMLTMVRNAAAVLTDSGGIQKEAYWLGVRCVTFREETEWIETLDGGWNRLVGADPDAIVQAVRDAPSKPRGGFGTAPGERPSEAIVNALTSARDTSTVSRSVR